MKDLLTLFPIWWTCVVGVLGLVLDLLAPRQARRGFLGYVTASGLFITGVAALFQWWEGPSLDAPFLKGVLHPDAYVAFFVALVAFTGAATALFAIDHLPAQGAEEGEFYPLLAFSVAGATSMLAATDLITLFLGLEIMSLSVYVMAALKKGSPYSTEAGMKYFVLGGFASALLLLGIAFLYGASGSLDMAGIARASSQSPLVPLAFFFVVAALGFKVAAVPFHMWTPDVYEGAPTPVTVFMAGAIKAASFAVAGRLVLTVFGTSGSSILLFLSIATMVVGNLLGIVQDNVKRILAYSSIAHAGYLLLGLYAASPSKLPPGFSFYLLTYVLASVGAFGVLSILSGKGVEDLSLSRVSGLGKRHPVLSALLLVSLLSLAGVPPFAGFFGKFILFRDVLAADREKNLPWVVVAVLNSLVALYYYLRIAMYVYFRDEEGEPVERVATIPGYVGAFVAVFLTVFVGLFPQRFLLASQRAVEKTALLVQVEKPSGSESKEVISREKIQLLRDASRRLRSRSEALPPPSEAQ